MNNGLKYLFIFMVIGIAAVFLVLLLQIIPVHAAENYLHTDKEIEVPADQIYNYHFSYYCHNYEGSRCVTLYDVYFSSKYLFFGYVQDGAHVENNYAYKNICMAYKNDDGDLQYITSSRGLRFDGVTITSYMAYSTYYDSNGEFARDELVDSTTNTLAKFPIIDFVHNDKDADISFPVFDSLDSLQFYLSSEDHDVEVPEDQIYDYYVKFYCHNYEGSRRVNCYEVKFSSKYCFFGYFQDGTFVEGDHEYKNICMCYEDENGDFKTLRSSTGLRIDGVTITSYMNHSVFYGFDGKIEHDEWFDNTYNVLAKFTKIDYVHNNEDIVKISFPVFDSIDSLTNYIGTGSTAGMINIWSSLDYKNVSLDTRIDKPVIVRDSQNDILTFSNASNDLQIEIQGRWYTTDDFTLYKDKLMWKYKYDSLIKGDLTDWVSAQSHTSSVGEFKIHDLGKQSFDDLLSQYPISSRNYSGGTNSFGNYFSGYDDALSQLKFLLASSGSAFNGYEIYARYYYVDSNAKVYVSKWTHFYNYLANSDGSSGSHLDDPDSSNNDTQSENGMTDDEKNENEKQENPRNDPDVKPKFDLDSEWKSVVGEFVGSVENIFDMLKKIFSLMGSVPAMFSQVFGFLPSWLINFISLSLALIVVMRVMGR